MLKDANMSEWQDENDRADFIIKKSLDSSTINRPAASCNDLAFSLEITAQWLKDGDYCVVATKRNQTNDGWLAKCSV